MQYIRLLLFYSVIFQSVIFQSCKFHPPPFFDDPSFSTLVNSSHPLQALQFSLAVYLLHHGTVLVIVGQSGAAIVNVYANCSERSDCEI